MVWNPAPYAAIADALALLLRPQVEVVLHDLAEDRIVHIAGNFSRRHVGDPSLNDLEDLEPFPAGTIGPYAKSNFDGRELKSISVVIPDEAARPAGLLCINLDISALQAAREVLDGLMQAPIDRAAQAEQLFPSDWRERINARIAAFLAERNASMAGLTSADAIDLAGALERDGLFAVRKAADHIATALGVSRATLYKRLAAARKSARTDVA
jgi:predicted transcriptional regulator YheO